MLCQNCGKNEANGTTGSREEYRKLPNLAEMAGGKTKCNHKLESR